MNYVLNFKIERKNNKIQLFLKKIARKKTFCTKNFYQNIFEKTHISGIVTHCKSFVGIFAGNITILGLQF
jgi:hypothetical protein